MGVLEVEGVTLSLNGETILNDISLGFWPGHIHSLAGLLSRAGRPCRGAG